MKFPHFVRCLVCFLLIVALVGNAFFTPVNASAVAFSKVAIDSLIVVGSAIMGLGVLAGSDTNAFKSLASSVVSALGLGNVIEVVTWVASGGAYKYAIPQTLVQAVRSQLWTSQTVKTESISIVKFPAGTTFTSGGVTVTLNASHYLFRHKYMNNSSNLVVINANGGRPSLSLSDGSSPTVNSYKSVYCCVMDLSSAEASRLGLTVFSDSYYDYQSAYYFLNGAYDVSPVETVIATEVYKTGTIAKQDDTIAAGYADWYANSVVVPGSVAGSSGDDDDEVYLPLAPGKTWGETTSGTQEDVWAGAGTWTDGESDVGSGTGAGSSASSISQTWLGQKLDSLVTSISGFFSNVISAVQAIPSAFSNWFDQIIELLRGLAGVISDALVEALSLVFALDSEYVQSEVKKMTGDFVFLGSMVDFGRGLVDVFYGIGSKPPVLYVDLHDAEGDIVWGDRVVFLDLTWYERYKPYGDAIISSFLWAWFGWRLLHNIPGLLNGTSGAVPSSSVFRSWGG